MLQAVQEVGIVAVVRIGGSVRPGAGLQALAWSSRAKAICGLVWNQTSSGAWALAHQGQVFGSVPGQVQPGRHRPGHGTFGIVAVDGDLAVAFLAQGAGVLPGDAHRALALLGEAGVIEDQDAVSLAGQSEHLLDTLAVEVVLVPSRGGEQSLELLFGGAGDARGDGIAVLVGQFGQQPSQVAIQGMSPFAAREMNMERLQERDQLGQWLGGGPPEYEWLCSYPIIRPNTPNDKIVLGDCLLLRPGYWSIKVECDKFESSPWYAVVMGQSGLTFGVSLYENLNILRKKWSGRITEEVNARETVALTLLFGDETEISVLDLEAVRKHGWDVAGPEAYPLIFRKERGMTMRPPLAWELELMEGCLRAIPAFIARHRPDDLSKHKMTVPVALGTLTLILSWVEDRDD